MALSMLKLFEKWQTPSKKGPIFSKSKKKLSLPTQDVISICVEDQEVRLALASALIPGQREIAQLLNFSGLDISSDEMVQKLQPLVAEKKIKPILVGVVPAHWVITRNIEVPSRDPKEIREIVSFQATRHTPYAKNEIIVDFLNLGVFKSVYTKVLLAIIPRTSVERFYALGTKLGIKVTKIMFAPEAAAYMFSRQINIAEQKLPIYLLRMDATNSDFMVIAKGALLFVRSIPIGTQHFSVAKEAYLTKFVDEVKRSLEAYQSENIDQNPTHLFITGAIQGLEALDPMIQSEMRLTVRRIADLENAPVRREVRERPNQNMSFSHLVAAALYSENLAMDLAPEENKLRKSLEDRSKEIIKTGVWAMVLLGVACIFFLTYVSFETIRISQLKSRYEPIKKEAHTVEEAYTHVQAIKNHLAGHGKSIEILTKLSDLLPPEIYLTDIRFDSDGKFVVKGTAYSKSTIFSFVNQMEAFELLRNVQTKHITGRTEEGVEMADFEITAALE